MREIKFRAWDKKGYTIYNPKRFIQKMYYDVQNTYDNCQGDSLPGHRSFGELLEDDRFILMQYTGLKDKNGVEVFKGDIIKYFFEEAFFQDSIAGLVEWSDIGSCFEVQHESVSFALNSMDFSFAEPEVIGNIYENPELLKEGT